MFCGGLCGFVDLGLFVICRLVVCWYFLVFCGKQCRVYVFTMLLTAVLHWLADVTVFREADPAVSFNLICINISPDSGEHDLLQNSQSYCCAVLGNPCPSYILSRGLPVTIQESY